MQDIKFYSSKSNAKRAALKAGLDLEAATLLEQDGQFAYVAKVEEAPEAPEAPVEPEVEDKPVAPIGADMELDVYSYACPHCGIDLDNGIGHHGDEVNGKPVYHSKFEYSCLGCGGEFGKPVTAKGKKATATGTGIKIEKNREERNGVKRPSVGGACRAIWDQLDAMQTEAGAVPKAKDIKAWAVTQGLNENNATIEYYLWRKFNGIRGRQ